MKKKIKIKKEIKSQWVYTVTLQLYKYTSRVV